MKLETIPSLGFAEFLIQEWSTGLRLTTIPQAMERLGVDQGLLEWRWRMAWRLEAAWREVLLSPGKQQQIAEALGCRLEEAQVEKWRRQVETWTLANILLTEEEKLVARHVLWRHRKESGLPSPGETAEALGIRVREVHNSLRMLGRLGFLSIADGRRPANFQLVEDWGRFTEGLGFSFHTVALDSGDRFGVP